MMSIEVKSNIGSIKAKVKAGKAKMIPAVTEAVIEYGNIYVRVDQGQLEESSYIKSQPEKGLAVWDTPYAKRMYYTGTPSRDVNPQASLMWADKGVKKHKKELDKVAQNAFGKGMG
nr:MAG TPA: Minor capsid protein [Caudoviricetes sp.]